MWQQIGSKSLYKSTLNGKTFYKSYNTIVACLSGNTLHMTSRKYSVTTTKHCNLVKYENIGCDVVETLPAELSNMHYAEL